MLSRRVLTISALAAAVLLYLVMIEGKQILLIPMFIAILAVVLSYIFQHQINWFYYKKNPLFAPEAIVALYMKTSKFFMALSEEEKILFGRKARLFVEAKEFIGMGMEAFPEDAKYMIAYYAVRSTWNTEAYLFRHYGRVVAYPHPFLSPMYEDQVHTVETEHVDGTIIFSLEHLLASFFNREKYYQVGFHAFAEILLRTKYADWPENPDDFWDKITRAFYHSEREVQDFIGLEHTDPRTIAFTFYLSHPKKMKELFPGLLDPQRESDDKTS